MKKHKMFINGVFTDAADGATRTIISPATEKSIATVPEGSEKDVDAAVEAAAAAFQSWYETTPADRSGMPHGGFRQSGYGKDMSMYALEDYTVVKHVMAKVAS